MSHEPMTDAELAELERVYQRIKPDEYCVAGVGVLHNAFPRLLATIRQERERCAKVALAEMGDYDAIALHSGISYNQACADIAARIRSGE